MNLPTAQELQQFLDYIQKSNDDYIKIGVRFVGNDDHIYQDCRTNTQNLAKVAGWIRYMKACVEMQNEMVD